MSEEEQGVALEGDKDPFKALEKDTPPESPAVKQPEEAKEEEKPVEGASTPEKDVPFHKHPRWIEREKELEEVKARETQISQELQELKDARSKPVDTSIPEWFRELYGENKVAWEKYSVREVEREKEIETRLIERQTQAVQEQQAEAQRWSKWVDDEITKLETEGNTFDRNKLIKTMLDYRPTDENNNFDFKAGLKIYQALEAQPDPAKAVARKELADKTTTSSKGEPAKKDYLTAADLRHRSWGNL